MVTQTHKIDTIIVELSQDAPGGESILFIAEVYETPGAGYHAMQEIQLNSYGSVATINTASITSKQLFEAAKALAAFEEKHKDLLS